MLAGDGVASQNATSEVCWPARMQRGRANKHGKDTWHANIWRFN